MADKKISQLPASTTPLAGTEVLPIVQSGTTKQVSVSNLTAGRAINVAGLTSSANMTIADGAALAWTGVTEYLLGDATNHILYVYTNGTFRSAWSNSGFSVTNGDITANTGNVVIGTSGKGIDFSATPGTGTSELLSDYEEGTWTPADASGGGLTLTINSATYVKIGRLVTIQMDVTYPVTANGGAASINGVPYTPANNNGAALYTNTANSVVGAQLTNSGVIYFQTVLGSNASPANMSGSAIRLTCSYQV